MPIKEMRTEPTSTRARRQPVRLHRLSNVNLRDAQNAQAQVPHNEGHLRDERPRPGRRVPAPLALSCRLAHLLSHRHLRPERVRRGCSGGPQTRLHRPHQFDHQGPVQARRQ